MRSFDRWGLSIALVLLVSMGIVDRRPLTVWASGIMASAYNIVQNAGTPLTVRSTLNCSTGMACSDDAVNKVTVLTATGGGGAPSFPVTVTGTVNSGGVPYFSSTTVESSSALLTSGAFVLGGGAGGAPTATNVPGTNVLAFLVTPSGANFNSMIQAGGVPIAQNSQSAAYTTVLSDGGKQILHPTSDNNARTFTIDSNANVAYPVGTTIVFVNQINTVTIAITADTLQLGGTATTGSRTLAVGGIATAVKIATTLWFISGPGLT